MSMKNSNTNEILDSIAEGLFTVDKNFKIIFFNRAAEKITGLKREEVLGRFCKHIFKSNLCFTKCPIAQVLESGKNTFDIEVLIPDNGDLNSNQSIPVWRVLIKI